MCFFPRDHPKPLLPLWLRVRPHTHSAPSRPGSRRYRGKVGLDGHLVLPRSDSLPRPSATARPAQASSRSLPKGPALPLHNRIRDDVHQVVPEHILSSDLGDTCGA